MTGTWEGEADSSATLRNDSQKSKSKNNSRFQEGITERKARAMAKARRSTERDPELEVVVGAEVADYVGGVAMLGIYG